MSSNNTPTTEERLTKLREMFDEYAPMVMGTIATIAGIALVRSQINRNNALTANYKLDLVERAEWREVRKSWEKQLMQETNKS